MLGKALFRASLVLLVIAVTVLIFLFRDSIVRFEEIGYAGAFLIGLVANATIILPMPGLLILFSLAAVFNPWLIGLLGAAGGAIGELSGYALGYSGRALARNSRWMERGEELVRKHGFVAVFIFALVPLLPLDILGLVGGILRYPVWKFVIAAFLGKAILYTGLALASVQGWDILERLFFV